MFIKVLKYVSSSTESPRGGAGEYNDRGVYGLYGAHEGALGLQGGLFGDNFFGNFGDYLNSTGKTIRISVKTFFLGGDHIIFRTKLQNFLRLFWTSQNRKSVIFELAQGPRSALGAPASVARQ